MNDGKEALLRVLAALGKALVLLAIALMIIASALAAAAVTLLAFVLLLIAYTLAGLVTYARRVANPTAEPVALPDDRLDQRAAFRSAGLAIAQGLCVLTSVLSLWLVVGWIGQTLPVAFPRLVYGLSCLLPALLLLARRNQVFGALLLGGLITLSLLAVLTYAPPVIVPAVFAAVHALSLLTAYRHIAHPPPEVSNGQQATIR